MRVAAHAVFMLQESVWFAKICYIFICDNIFLPKFPKIRKLCLAFISWLAPYLHHLLSTTYLLWILSPQFSKILKTYWVILCKFKKWKYRNNQTKKYFEQI